ncbi:MAG TPA: thioredoxin domain-containing protein [Candidatus Saccharibacteria bacterium]|nr:thioredoxin domain-containing protein [Candidatus Saccharibacteria bacterium]HRQ97867.1 thioredoxin domain-containing protein [Candidatus Saccharibacteria bacterium]
MSKLAWIIFAAVAAGILTLLIVLSPRDKIDVSSINPSEVQSASVDNGNIADHVFGKVGSPVTLIEYGDFQCPGCGSAHPRVKAISEEYKDQLQFVFRNFPLTSIHPNAKAAAGAAEAAGLQGKYWEMHDLIYQSQTSWSLLTDKERTDAFNGYARQLGLDIDKFESDISSTAVTKKITFDQTIGKKAGVDSTPTFYLNGVKLDQATWADDTAFKAAIDAELTKAGIALPKTDSTKE